MGEALGYEQALRALRGSLAQVAGNARAFAIRARGRPALISGHSWAELAQIEQLLAAKLEAVLRRELRAEPWSGFARLRALARGIRGGLEGERSFARRLLEEARAHPVERWRSGTPQLEETLWPFFSARTRYLANTLALALDEPTPHRPLIWHPARREFRGG